MDHGNVKFEDSIKEVVQQLKADDGSFRVAVVVRDKQRPYDPPTSLRVFGIDEIQNFVEGIPDQVHNLIMTFGEVGYGAKISLTSKTKSYNLHAQGTAPLETVSKMSKEFNADLFRSILPAMPEVIRQEFDSFLPQPE